MQQLANFIKESIPISDSDLNYVCSCFSIKKVTRNQILLMQGNVCNEFYFIVSGCIRVFFINQKGIEKTNHIALENTIITAMSSFISQKPSFENIDVLEDSTLFVIHYSQFYNLINTCRAWELFYRLILETAYIAKIKRIEFLSTLSAIERYKVMQDENPSIFQRVSNKIASSYLDISPETLSRLKSNLLI